MPPDRSHAVVTLRCELHLLKLWLFNDSLRSLLCLRSVTGKGALIKVPVRLISEVLFVKHLKATSCSVFPWQSLQSLKALFKSEVEPWKLSKVCPLMSRKSLISFRVLIITSSYLPCKSPSLVTTTFRFYLFIESAVRFVTLVMITTFISSNLFQVETFKW